MKMLNSRENTILDLLFLKKKSCSQLGSFKYTQVFLAICQDRDLKSQVAVVSDVYVAASPD